MRFYHGTTEDNWKKIKEEGVLWGRVGETHMGRPLSRVTWLAVDKKNAGIYNNQGITDEPCVVLEVDFPKLEYWKNWQMTEYDPIKIDRIKIIRRRGYKANPQSL